MPYHYPQTGGYCYGSDIASAVNLSLEDGSYSDYNTSYDQIYENYQTYDLEAWKKKSVKWWTGTDIVHWMSSVAREIDVCPTDMMSEKFATLDGYQLSNLSRSDFEWRDRLYGNLLYNRLQVMLEREGRAYHPLRDHSTVKQESEEQPVLTNLEVSSRSNKPLPPSPPPSPCTPPPPTAKKGRGRPRLPRRKKKTEKLGRLWEFLRDLLKNPDYCPSMIVWENYEEGMFRFVHSDKVAKLWGSKKDNPDMNYEKLSRAMRYYYKSKVLQPVYGRRLVYKFGPNATGWRVDNPNFVK